MPTVRLDQEPIFTLHAGDEAFPGMKVTSRWEGFLKLEGEGGTAIVFDARFPAGRKLADAFDAPTVDWHVSYATGAIREALRMAELKHALSTAEVPA